MDDRLYEILTKLPRRNLIHLMWGALDEMQSYNGRSRHRCIMLTIGNAAESEQQVNGTMKYKIKSLAALKRVTHYMGL